MRKPPEFRNHPMPFEAAPTYRAWCAHVVDGDTLDVLVDLGLFQYAYVALRLRGLNAAEIFGPSSPEEYAAGLEDKAALENLVLGRPVFIRTQKDRASFGRFVADVFVANPDGTWASVVEIMLQGGHAWPRN